MDYWDHPGYLGLTGQGVILLHADWPMYPEEHGSDLALLWLTMFPPETRFLRIADIDRCVLFLANVKCTKHQEPFSPDNFHVAVWHDDLLSLAEQGMIQGVKAVSERRWRELEWRSMNPEGRRVGFRLPDGTFEEVTPQLERYDDEILEWPSISTGRIVVTSRGRDGIREALRQTTDDISALGPRVTKLVELQYYDTAVREACVGLEHRLKTWLESDRWGDHLVEQFMARARDAKLHEGYERVLRGELRACFKFVRNDLMHNFVDMAEDQCRAALFRLVRAKHEIDEVIDHIDAVGSN